MTEFVKKSGKFASFFRRFGKGFAAALAVIVLAVVVFSFFIPQGAATIPLKVSYTVGETLMYDTTNRGTDGSFNGQTNQLQMTQSYNTSLTDTEFVAGFDGQTYTINHNQSFSVGTQLQLIQTSYTEQLNNTGYSQIISPGLGSNQASINQTSVNPVLAFLSSPSVKVGDTQVIPISTGQADVTMTGNVKVTFVDIQNITVPAGTFKVFRVDSSSSDTTLTFKGALFGNGTMALNQNFTEQSYVEFDTGKLVESTESFYSVTTCNDSRNVRLPDFVDNATTVTQLEYDVMPGQPLPTARPSQVSMEQQQADSFLRSVSGIDMEHYSIQSQEAIAPTFYKFTLSSNDSLLDVSFNFDSQGYVDWCTLYAIHGSPSYTLTQSNQEAANVLLTCYQNYAHTAYVPTLQNMLSNLTSGQSATLTQGAITLTVTSRGGTTSFVWTDSQNAHDNLTLTMINGGLSFFNAVWT